MCGVDIEHLLHLFLDCNFAKDCWSVMGVQLDALQVEEAQTRVLDWLATESMEVRVQLAKLLWGIKKFESVGAKNIESFTSHAMEQ